MDIITNLPSDRLARTQLHKFHAFDDEKELHTRSATEPLSLRRPYTITAMGTAQRARIRTHGAPTRQVSPCAIHYLRTRYAFTISRRAILTGVRPPSVTGVNTADLADLASIWSSESGSTTQSDSTLHTDTAESEHLHSQENEHDRERDLLHHHHHHHHPSDSLEFDPAALEALDEQLLESPQDAFAVACWAAAVSDFDPDLHDVPVRASAHRPRRARRHAYRDDLDVEFDHGFDTDMEIERTSRSEADLITVLDLAARGWRGPNPNLNRASEDSDASEVKMPGLYALDIPDPGTPKPSGYAYDSYAPPASARLGGDRDLPPSSPLVASPLSFSLVSTHEGSLADQIAPDQSRWADWTDGLNMLRRGGGHVSSQETNEFIQALTEIGLKIKLLDLSGDKVEIPSGLVAGRHRQIMTSSSRICMTRNNDLAADGQIISELRFTRLQLRRNADQLVFFVHHFDRTKKVTFGSARTCTYDELMLQVEKAFLLASRSFSIKWTDDDGEEVDIHTDEDVDEAIRYYCPPEEPVGSSSSSNFSYRSLTRSNRIVMKIQVIVEYDGPALSDTASLASIDDFKSHSGSERPMSLDVPHFDDLDDDAVTVSSKDTGSSQDMRRKSDSLLKKLLSKPSRSALRLPSRNGQRSRSRNSDSGASDIHSSYRQSTEGDAAAYLTDHSGQIGMTLSASSSRRYPSDPSAVLERLKLEDQPEYTLTPQRSIVSPAWIREQARLQDIRLGIPRPPSDADTFSLNTDHTVTSDDLDGRLSMDNPPLVKYHQGGKTYYQPNAGPRDSLRETSSTEYDASASDNVHGHRERPISMTTVTEGSGGILSSGYPVSTESSSNRMSLSQESESQQIFYTQLLVPDEVTACSECKTILESMRYVCTTCGEKTPLPRQELEALLESGKGKAKSTSPMYNHSSGSGSTVTYPPHAHRSASSSSTAFSGTDTDVYRSGPFSKPLPDLPSTSPTLVGGSSSHHSHSQTRSNSSSSSSSSSRTSGYELCAMCIQKSGMYHGVYPDEETVSSIGMGGGSPPSPQVLSARLRRAPDRQGQLRHAYCEKMWEFNGWVDIAPARSQSTKKATRRSARTIHNIHPIHAFLVMPDRPVRSQSAPDVLYHPVTVDAADDQSMTHPGIKCYHCMQDIIGARFRCIDCSSVDICSNCESAGLPGDLHTSEGGHDSSHVMLKIPRPLPVTEVETLSRHARNLQNGGDGLSSSLLRSSPGSASSSFAKTIINGEGDSMDHLTLCNSCGESIIGVRYQCLSCPSKPTSYSLCASCEKKSYQVHDPMHVFAKLDRPVDNPAPLQSEFPIIPSVYSLPAGPQSPTAPSNPEDYLKTLRHPRAFCDRHMEPIFGKWLRCLYCAEGKDLCTKCEAIDSHDNTHIFLEFKAPVDMQSFTRLVGLDSENEEYSPILHDPVYYS
ncbi:hypothetical protein EVG20_g714 [Dentipellis fragilis]|uniref:ZZ-type domain-containing protein n=1 Tax=Dentipellis fragilis TaxID=205917 RepID=A0A4Y9ZCH8_9AGAM|nr:hypothetical protein EVG20_g714 [Dentipellis fragilis]